MLDARSTPQSEPLLAGLTRFAMGAVGSKVVMAVTGLGLWGFVITHMAGNLSMWGGRDAMNHYAALLKSVPELVWAVRAGLLIGFPVHIFMAIRTAKLNRAARPVPYAHAVMVETSMASKTMLLSGLLVLWFFIYHLAHFTWHLTNPDHVQLLADGSVDVYSMVVRGFGVWWISLIYLAGQLLLAQHLRHGIHSLFQHLGLWGASWTPFLRKAATVVAYGIALGFSSVPIAVTFGLMRLP